MDETPPPRRAYRGRRRAESPRTRYAAVFTTAVVGAGIVALGVSAALPEPRNDLSLEASGNFDDVSVRTGSDDRASRSRTGSMSTSTVPAPDVWILPMQRYTLTSFYGERWGRLHPGVDLGAPRAPRSTPSPPARSSSAAGTAATATTS